MISYGEPGGFTAMAQTVGMPAAIAVKLVLTGKLQIRGTHIPINPSVYQPILEELAGEGIAFVDKARPL